ncbi:MAG: glycogen synthase GlgA [Acidobacteriota bacterium]|nr:glycogen synthase GlgA [Acidobacteriota bacterium]
MPKKRTPSPRVRSPRPAAPAHRILMIASEMSPFARTGGLGEVLGSLPAALGRLGVDVTVVLPHYGWPERVREADRFTLTVGDYAREVALLEHDVADRVHAVFVDCPELYARDGGLYGFGTDDYPDNARRFAFLARAALERSVRRGERPTVVHAHDWHAGLAPVYLRTIYARHPLLGGVPTVLTIHNLAYQGVFDAGWLPRLDLDWSLFTIDRLEYWGRISFLKAGVVFSDLVTTVSPTYAREIQTPAYGFGFEGILRTRRDDLVGILNGIDTERWNPAADPYLPAPYDATALDEKVASKCELLKAFDLAVDDTRLARPLVGMVTRLVEQKGFDLIADVSERLAAMDATFVLLGSGARWLEDRWLGIAQRYPDRFRVRIGFDERLSHLIEAGSDVFLMPSRFEPCGLNQLYSLRYGTIPIVHATGGLADTVIPYNPRTGRGTGFVFTDYTAEGLLGAVEAALRTFRDRRKWLELQARGMAEDHSWDASAAEYVKVYDRVVDGRRTARAERRAAGTSPKARPS